MSDPLIGQSLGDYQILRLIKRTGMSTVYLARDRKLPRDVVVKTMLPAESGDESFAARFEQEAFATARLSHPNIVHIYDFGRQGELSYMVMEYLPGGSLHDLLIRLEREGRVMEPRQAANLVATVALALEHAHTAGIVHRDVKPSNILFAADGRPVLMDLGISKVKEGPHLTRSQTSVGTPEYMSPEQGRGEPVDGRSDIYSLGVVLYQLLSGALPFQADTPWGLIYKHVEQPPPALPNTVSPALRSVTAKALAKRPEERFQSGQEFNAALKQALETPGKRLYPTPVTHAAGQTNRSAGAAASDQTCLIDRRPAPQKRKLHPVAWVGIVAALVVVGVLLGFLIAPGLRPGTGEAQQVSAVTAVAAFTEAAPTAAPATMNPAAMPSATAVAAQTPSPAATWTVEPTMRATSVPRATSTVAPTAAPVVVATATAVPVPTQTPTLSAKPAAKATARPPATKSPVATAASRVRVPAPELFRPNNTNETGSVTFAWNDGGHKLAATEGYAVLVWKADDARWQGYKGLDLPTVYDACSGAFKGLAFTVPLATMPSFGPGRYNWSVVVVNTSIRDQIGRCAVVSEQPAPLQFTLSEAPGPAPAATSVGDTGKPGF